MTLDRQKIADRAAMLNQMRDFFNNRGFLEVETPLLSPHLIPESSIENFRSELVSPYGENKPLFLIPSPEIWMKQLLAMGSGDIYQICKSFRNSEQISPVHNPEFTMLEWYKTGISASDNIKICEDLVSALTGSATPPECRSPFRTMSMEEAFREFAGFSLEENMDAAALEARLDLHQIPRREGESWEVLFHKLFLTLVEPELPADRPLVLRDYPSRLATLAAEIPGTPWSDRWELYMKGIEIANCYTEETRFDKIKAYYTKESKEKSEAALVPVVTSMEWVENMRDFPSSSGTAVGVDRLLSVLMGDKSIQGVILFPLGDILL